MPKVRVYTTQFCPYCVRAKRLLEARGIPFEEIDVTNDPTTRAWLARETRQRTVPQIFVDDRPIGGSDELHALDRAGDVARWKAT